MSVGMGSILGTVLFLALGPAPNPAAPRSPDPGPAKPTGNTAAAATTRLDRGLDNGAWEHTEPITAFLQRDPAEGAPATEHTEVRVLYDTPHLYVWVRAFDRDPSKIVGLRTRRDESSPSAMSHA